MTSPAVIPGGSAYRDLSFEPAAALLTRVVSRPGANRLCLDLGHKAVSAENPMEKRVRFADPTGITFLAHSEEHLLIQTEKAAAFPIGTPLYGIPWHVCPTVALHDQAWIVTGGRITGETWAIEARKRLL